MIRPDGALCIATAIGRAIGRISRSKDFADAHTGTSVPIDWADLRMGVDQILTSLGGCRRYLPRS